jgi:hypothetical protein
MGSAKVKKEAPSLFWGWGYFDLAGCAASSKSSKYTSLPAPSSTRTNDVRYESAFCIL